LLRDQLTNVPPTGAPVSGRTRRFEWLRLVSAMLVVLCHFAALYAAVFHSFDVDSATFSAAPSTITTALTALYFQFHGAYVFFAISGFVITRPWFATARTPAAIAFLGRRAFRLLPAATVAIIAVAYFDFYHLDFRQVDFATLLQNLLYVNWLPPYTVPPVLIVTWTLAVEWLFYFAAPFVVSAIVRLQHPILAVVTLAILLSIALRTISPNAYAYPLYFAAGIAIAIRRSACKGGTGNDRSLLLMISGCFAILAASLVYASQAPINWRPVQWAWRPFDTFVVMHLVGTVALLQWASNPTSSDAGERKILTKLPELTYSIYLWHLPACMLVFAAMAAVGAPAASMPDHARLPILLAAAILLTLALSTLSYLIAERPYFRWKQRQSLPTTPAEVA